MPDSPPADAQEHPLVPVTWHTFETACFALDDDDGDPLHPDDVLAGRAEVRVAAGTAQALLDVLIAGPAPDLEGRRERLQLATAAGRLFFQAARRQAAEGAERARHYAEKAAVWGRMQGGTGVPPSLSRVLTRFDPSHHETLRTMPLRDMVFFLLTRSADETSEELRRKRR